jgi:hypothetical protein
MWRAPRKKPGRSAIAAWTTRRWRRRLLLQTTSQTTTACPCRCMIARKHLVYTCISHVYLFRARCDQSTCIGFDIILILDEMYYPFFLSYLHVMTISSHRRHCHRLFSFPILSFLLLSLLLELIHTNMHILIYPRFNIILPSYIFNSSWLYIYIQPNSRFIAYSK